MQKIKIKTLNENMVLKMYHVTEKRLESCNYSQNYQEKHALFSLQKYCFQ